MKAASWHLSEYRFLELNGKEPAIPFPLRIALYRGGIPSTACLNLLGMELWCRELTEHHLSMALPISPGAGSGWVLPLYQRLGPSPKDMLRRASTRSIGLRCKNIELCIGSSEGCHRPWSGPACWEGDKEEHDELFKLIEHWRRDEWVVFLG